jgi:Effector Associated Constant Component 1
MDVMITVGGETTALHGLHRWLSEDPDLVQVGDLMRRATPNSGHMGALDVLTVVLPNAIAFAALMSSYAMWRKGRGGQTDVTFTVDGLSVTVRDASPETLERIMELVGRTPANR